MTNRDQLAGLAIMVAVGLACGPVRALDIECGDNGVRDVFWQYQGQPGTYELVYGKITSLRDMRYDAATNTATWDARFTGYRGTQTGFDAAFQTEITVTDQLGSLVFDGPRDPARLQQTLSAEAGLVYLQQLGESYQAATTFCLPLIDSDPAHVRQALNCVNGRRCAKPD